MSKPQQSLDTDDALNPKFNAAALDFLLIELVPLAQRITEQLQARDQALVEELKRSKIFNSQSTVRGSSQSEQVSGDAGRTGDGSSKEVVPGVATSNVTSLGFSSVSEDTREAIFWRLDGLGYRVGQGLVER